MPDIKRRTFLAAAMAGSIAAASGALPAHARKSIVHDIGIRRFKFVPRELDVRVGDVVRWTNFDLSPHTATADDGGFDTGTLEQGQSGSIEITGSTSRTYFCAFHPHMKAKLNVS
jgi:plastocyanin